VNWTLPEGWRVGPEKAGRYATLITAPVAGEADLTVSRLGGDLLGNVNRWRDQVGLDAAKDIASGTTEVTTEQGVKIFRVDASGMAAKGGPAMPPFIKGHP
jgi:hypothetical protein